MPQYIKINISDGVDLNKTSASKECKVCHYWLFKDIGFESEEHICNGCHHVLTRGYFLEKSLGLIWVQRMVIDVFCWVLVKMKH